MVRPTPAVTVSWVTVGDPGNPNDTINTGTNPNYGAVGYTFRIMKFEWTNAQYLGFLNAVDPDGTNPNGIYSASMGTNARGGISFTSSNSVGSKYASRTNMADKPVNFVSWFAAARVANWLHNGAPVSGSSSALASAPQNTGAYTLGTGTSGNAPAKNAAAQYWIPTENEWYKAAYYRGSGTNAGYWKFGTQSSSAPTAVGATTVGTGSSGGTSPVITGNAANWNVAADWGGQNGNVTTVGTNGRPSAYGAFDMTGNVGEWNDLNGVSSATRGSRGGSWIDGPVSFYISSTTPFTTGNVTVENHVLGFRLATTTPGVPEIDGSGARLALVLVAFGLALLERVRQGR